MGKDNGFTLRASLSFIDKRGAPGKWKRKYVPEKRVAVEEYKPAPSNTRQGSQLDLLLDLITNDFVDANVLAKAWHVAESKFWRGRTWSSLRKKADEKEF